MKHFEPKAFDPSATYNSPTHFTSSLVANTNCQLQLAGMHFVPSIENFLFVERTNSSGIKDYFSPEVFTFDWDAATGILTVGANRVNFKSGDVFRVFIASEKAGFLSPLQAFQMLETSPLDQHTKTTPVSTSGETDGTFDYYFDIDHVKNGSLHIFDTPGAAGTNQYRFYLTNQDDGTAAASCAYLDVTNYYFGAATINSGDAALDEPFDFDTPLMGKYLHVEVTRTLDGGNNDGAWDLLFKDKAL